MSLKKQTLLILDGNALLHRAWHAIPPLTTKDGLVVNAVYGFAMIMEKIRENIKPDYVVAAWDLPGKTFRHELFAPYKGTRERKEQELYDQIPLIQELLTAYGIPSLSVEGYEADDIIGTLSQKTQNQEDMETLIMSGDLDLLQLVDDHTTVLFFQKGISETKRYNKEAVLERFGLSPEELIDYKALRGDTSDNIPGVKGIGEKTAETLMKMYGSLEEVFKALEAGKIPEKMAKKLQGQKETALLARKLVKIVRDVPLSFDLEALKKDGMQESLLLELFRKWEFRRLIDKYHKEEKRASEPSVVSSHAAITRDVETLRLQLKAFYKKSVGFFLLQKQADLFGSSFAGAVISDGKTHLLIPEPETIHLQECLEMLKQAKEVVVYDIKSLLHTLANQSLFLKSSDMTHWFDLMIAGYLLSSGNRSYDIQSIAASVLHAKLPNMPELLTTQKDQQIVTSIIALFPVLTEHLQAQMKKEGVEKLFKETEMPLASVLFQMEQQGICLDVDFLQTLSAQFEKILSKLTRQIHKEAGETFNINSPLQMAPILFEKMHLSTKGMKKTKSGFSTAASELEKIQNAHPIVPLIQEYREIAKLKNTYVDALPILVKKDGRIHSHFNQVVAATGRLSSSDPNLQNIPIRTPLGHQIRKAFVCAEGKTLIAADYSQIELRLAAILAKDKPFIEAFKEGADIHTRTASEAWNIPENEVTKDQRYAAKAINFGILYGMGPRSLARSTNLSLSEAQIFLDRYFEIHYAIRDYIDETKRRAHEQGYVETFFGRRRYLPEIHSGVPMLVAQAERMAINMPMQGTQADIIKIAMIQVDAWVRTLRGTFQKSMGDKIHLLLQVHDELVFEVDTDYVDTAAKSIRAIMESVVTLEVPLVVDIEAGKNWGEMEKL